MTKATTTTTTTTTKLLTNFMSPPKEMAQNPAESEDFRDSIQRILLLLQRIELFDRAPNAVHDLVHLITNPQPGNYPPADIVANKKLVTLMLIRHSMNVKAIVLPPHEKALQAEKEQEGFHNMTYPNWTSGTPLARAPISKHPLPGFEGYALSPNGFLNRSKNTLAPHDVESMTTARLHAEMRNSCYPPTEQNISQGLRQLLAGTKKHTTEDDPTSNGVIPGLHHTGAANSPIRGYVQKFAPTNGLIARMQKLRGARREPRVRDSYHFEESECPNPFLSFLTHPVQRMASTPVLGPRPAHHYLRPSLYPDEPQNGVAQARQAGSIPDRHELTICGPFSKRRTPQ
ncbi:hypothetical protein K504DRAFT_500576 [Pleomassaria siparia CBS 279.74]|uniref:Uncharacterized protein n=1 Tax=Pleomassaria siparia CBS 279.74 TaxID=1314801 RepID=A0A6G1KHH6_9PLEO|nr:hypothetical protein K504DRAFT_500576 [Pleomassaria siparia CBS 279.74]